LFSGWFVPELRTPKPLGWRALHGKENPEDESEEFVVFCPE
jgi:hypothetical protein